MGELTKNFKKEEIFYFARQVKYLIDLLNGTTLYCKDPNRLKYIEEIIKVEKLLYKYEPTIYEN